MTKYIYLYFAEGLSSIIIKESWFGIQTVTGKLNNIAHELRQDNHIYNKNNGRKVGVKLIGNTDNNIQIDFIGDGGCDKCCCNILETEHYNIDENGDLVGSIIGDS